MGTDDSESAMRAPEARIAQFRAEWPEPATWAEVRAADPAAFRDFWRGAILLLLAPVASLCFVVLAYEWPFTLTLPSWLTPLAIVALLWASAMLWLLGVLMMRRPADVRRGLAIAAFGRERGLRSSAYGVAPERLGIMFAEANAVPLPKHLRERAAKRSSTDPSQQSLFRIEHSLHRGSRPLDPELQIAVASYTGGKNDQRGPKQRFRFMTLELPRALPHLMIDALHNGRLPAGLTSAQRMRLEGDFDRHFAVYAPEGYGRDALELLTPDVMACLIDHGSRWDIEVVEDRLIVASSRVRGSSDRDEITALLHFSELIGDELGYQASTYTDPRALRPRSQIAAPGQRLRKRSAAWGVWLFVGVVAFLLAFPHVLGWLLDHVW